MPSLKISQDEGPTSAVSGEQKIGGSWGKTPKKPPGFHQPGGDYPMNRENSRGIQPGGHFI
jgi:hypothetical protein